MKTERKEHISEKVIGLDGHLVVSYDRVNGKADTVKIMVVSQTKEYAVFTTSTAILADCIELLTKMSNEVWPKGVSTYKHIHDMQEVLPRLGYPHPPRGEEDGQ